MVSSIIWLTIGFPFLMALVDEKKALDPHWLRSGTMGWHWLAASSRAAVVSGVSAIQLDSSPPTSHLAVQGIPLRGYTIYRRGYGLP